MDNEAAIRLGFFFGILVLVALGELLSPRRALDEQFRRRGR